MADPTTLRDLIAGGDDDAPALLGEDRGTLNYGALRAHMKAVLERLNALGVGRNDRVAIVLPNGPEMASAFVTIGAGATTAPLNPAYRAEEFDFYLSDLDAKLLVIEQGMDSPARAVAAKLDIPIVELVPDADTAGVFTLQGDGPGGDCKSGWASADDAALVLHTSGTTSRPKIVPLSHENVCVSARNIADTLELSPADRCLNVMPLFHIHGLIGVTLSSLAAGASIFASPGFNALKFFGWMEQAEPTWYSAVPTMHQAILGRAERNRALIEKTGLRLIRSSSSSLAPQVMQELEEMFGCPVIESYGMTEAAHQMASNLLPPGERKPGSVGVAAGPEIRILDESGKQTPEGEVGEVCIRGRNVTRGYENNAKANAESFTDDGWFRTGDQGVLDGDGYLTITGRLKEIINRGGEKISPREVDEVLLDHPAVGQAVTFAMPHPKLGEEVAAAIVLKDDQDADEQTIRAFAKKRLADFKVPRKVVFLDEIPKGATGKLQRIGLHEKLKDELGL